jgi:hypothetical protein
MAYIKIKFRFWSIQPVFHIYDFHYYLSRPGIIHDDLPIKNRYCNFSDIETVKYESLSILKIDQFTRFIRKHFLRNQENKFLPKKQNILPYFEGHNSQSFFSFYTEPEIFTDKKTGELINSYRMISVMTSRPLHISLYERKRNITNFDVYYVDYLCVDKEKRKAGIAPQIIQTHHYNQRHANKEIQVSLFKREGELTGIVPLCIYKTYGYNLDYWVKPTEFDATISLVECGTTNIHYYLDFLRENTNRFDLFIAPEISNILELIKTKNIFIYMLLREDTIQAIYLFKKSCTEMRKGKEAITLFASINILKKKQTDIFIQGFVLSLFKICERFSAFKYVLIEEVSDNYLVLNELKNSEFNNPTAYFFYNYRCHTINAKRSLIIC